MRAPDGPRPNLWALGAAKLDESGSLARIYDEEAAEFLRACESYRERRFTSGSSARRTTSVCCCPWGITAPRRSRPAGADPGVNP
jgi:hypothetical protein